MEHLIHLVHCVFNSRPISLLTVVVMYHLYIVEVLLLVLGSTCSLTAMLPARSSAAALEAVAAGKFAIDVIIVGGFT